MHDARRRASSEKSSLSTPEHLNGSLSFNLDSELRCSTERGHQQRVTRDEDRQPVQMHRFPPPPSLQRAHARSTGSLYTITHREKYGIQLHAWLCMVQCLLPCFKRKREREKDRKSVRPLSPFRRKISRRQPGEEPARTPPFPHLSWITLCTRIYLPVPLHLSAHLSF